MKDKPAPRGTPVLWREPADIASRDLFLGPGGASMRPDVRSVTFVKEEKGGYSTKYRVKDGGGARVGGEDREGGAERDRRRAAAVGRRLPDRDQLPRAAPHD